ncbi:MAG: flagellar hook-length control protein FliK [Pseudomonadota bacterium]
MACGKMLPQATPIPTDIEGLPSIDLDIDNGISIDMSLPAQTDALSAPVVHESPVAAIAPELIPASLKTDVQPSMPVGPVLTDAPTVSAEAKPAPLPTAKLAAPVPALDGTLAPAVKPAAPPDAQATPIAALTPQARETLQPDRIRERREVVISRTETPAATRDAAVLPRVTISPEVDVVPRVVATPESAVVPDRTLPTNTPTATVATLASAINLASGAPARDPGLIPQGMPDLVRTPVTDPAWGDRIGQRVVMMAGNQIQQAEIRLTPAELGPVRVQISVEDGAANITFQAQHAVTREAIEAAMPRLREMLADSGLQLGQSNVGGDGVAEGQRDRREAANSPKADEPTAELADEAGRERQKTVGSDGLIDTFA